MVVLLRATCPFSFNGQPTLSLDEYRNCETVGSVGGDGGDDLGDNEAGTDAVDAGSGNAVDDDIEGSSADDEDKVWITR